MDEWRLIALIVAKAGFGSLAEIEHTPADLVLDAYEYIGFLNDYTDTTSEMNREKQ